MLREWYLETPTYFGQSKKRILHAKKQGKGRPHKRQKKHDNKINDCLKAHVQSVTVKFISSRFEDMDINDEKSVSFQVNEANAKLG